MCICPAACCPSSGSWSTPAEWGGRFEQWELEAAERSAVCVGIMSGTPLEHGQTHTWTGGNGDWVMCWQIKCFWGDSNSLARQPCLFVCLWQYMTIFGDLTKSKFHSPSLISTFIQTTTKFYGLFLDWHQALLKTSGSFCIILKKKTNQPTNGGGKWGWHNHYGGGILYILKYDYMFYSLIWSSRFKTFRETIENANIIISNR